MTASHDEEGFADHLRAMDDESLLRTLAQMEAAPSDYRPSALPAATAEVTRRGLSTEEQAAIAQRVEEEGATDAQSVGGWLLLLCIILTILNPIGEAVRAAMGFYYLAGGLEQAVRSWVAVNAAAAGGFALWSYSAGTNLWQRKPDGIRMAKAFLWFNVAWQLFAMGWRLEIGLEVSLGLPGRALLHAIVWTLYLRYSKRVANTYALPSASGRSARASNGHHRTE